MLRLKLHTTGENSWLSTGSTSLFRFRGGHLCGDYAPEVTEPLGATERQLGAAGFDSVSFSGAVLVWFENAEGEPSDTYGPFQDFCTSDGAAFADAQLLATYRSQTRVWVEQATTRQWQEMVISAAQDP
ncbi:MAG TPA: hypothetical protein VME21_07115 [Steroidobacteraceae bacterium]|nr:hypothetical protein [Steroidobacteraceae bacterium]